jgi:hypothetical protein
VRFQSKTKEKKNTPTLSSSSIQLHIMNAEKLAKLQQQVRIGGKGKQQEHHFVSNDIVTVG